MEGHEPHPAGKKGFPNLPESHTQSVSADAPVEAVLLLIGQPKHTVEPDSAYQPLAHAAHALERVIPLPVEKVPPTHAMQSLPAGTPCAVE